MNRRMLADDPVYDSVRFDVRGPSGERWTSTAQLHRDFADAAEQGYANFPDDFRVVQPDGSLGSVQQIFDLPLGTFTWTYQMGPHTMDGSFRLIAAENGATVAFVDNMSQRSLAKPYEPSVDSSGSREASASPITGDISGNSGGALPDQSPSDKDGPNGAATRRATGSSGPGWWWPAFLAGLLMGGAGFVLGRRRPAAGGTDERGGVRAIPTRTAGRRTPGAVVAAREEATPLVSQGAQGAQGAHGAPSVGADSGEGCEGTAGIAHAARVAHASQAHTAHTAHTTLAAAQQAPEASSVSASPAVPLESAKSAAPVAHTNPATPANPSTPAAPAAAEPTPPDAHGAPRRLLDRASQGAPEGERSARAASADRRPGSGGPRATSSGAPGEAPHAEQSPLVSALYALGEFRGWPVYATALTVAVFVYGFSRAPDGSIFPVCSTPIECSIKADSIGQIWLGRQLQDATMRGDTSSLYHVELLVKTYEKQLPYVERACVLSGPESPVCEKFSQIRDLMLPSARQTLEEGRRTQR